MIYIKIVSLWQSIVFPMRVDGDEMKIMYTHNRRHANFFSFFFLYPLLPIRLRKERDEICRDTKSSSTTSLLFIDISFTYERVNEQTNERYEHTWERLLIQIIYLCMEENTHQTHVDASKILPPFSPLESPLASYPPCALFVSESYRRRNSKVLFLSA